MALPMNPFPEHKCRNIPGTPKDSECLFCDYNRQFKDENRNFRLIPFDVPDVYPEGHDGKKLKIKAYSQDEMDAFT
jgi:hypothetical protein